MKTTKQLKMGIVIGVIAAAVSALSTNADADGYWGTTHNGYPMSAPTGTAGSGGTLVSWNMNGYPAYGPDSGGTDIVYAGYPYTWLLTLPGSPTLTEGMIYKLKAWVVLDPSSNPTNDYNLNISVNNASAGYTGNNGLVHGQFSDGGHLTNWTVLELPVSYTAGPIKLEISLTGTGTSDPSTHWVALDKVELVASPVPIPSTAWLLGTALAGLSFIGKSRTSRNSA